MNIENKNIVSLDLKKEEKILENLGRVRSIEQGRDGYIYVGIENLGIVRLNPKK